MSGLTRLPRTVAKRLLKGDEKKAQQAVVDQRIERIADLPPARIAVIGAGKYARKHLEILALFGNVTLVGVSNRGGSDISSFKQEYGAEATFGNYQEMIEVTQPDAAVVVVSHFETAAVARYCLERGIPCLIEKPAGITSADTAMLAATARQANCLNMVGMNRRFISSFHVAMNTILSHGKLHAITLEAPEDIRLQRRQRADQQLVDHFMVANTIHAIDLLRMYGGDLAAFTGYKNADEEPYGDSFTSIMRFENGALGTFISHWLSGMTGWSLTLYGDGVKVTHDAALKGEVIKGRKRTPLWIDPIDLAYKPGLFAQDEAFIRALTLHEPLPYPASTLDDAIKTMRLIENILGETPVPVS